jgi:hypothetical protein
VVWLLIYYVCHLWRLVTGAVVAFAVDCGTTLKPWRFGADMGIGWRSVNHSCYPHAIFALKIVGDLR